MRLRNLKKIYTHSSLQSESGQSAFFGITIILSVLMFFSFVMNTSVLVIAKISLQNAADAAAYSGAAVQARQLNAISYLNYEMRQQYKKFLTRYIYFGNFGQTGFGTHGGDQYDFPLLKFDQNNPGGQAIGTNVPSVCLPIGGANVSATCKNLNFWDPNATSGQTIVPGTVNSTTQALYAYNDAVKAIMAKICEGRGAINEKVLLAWLYRTGAQDDTMVTQMVNDWANAQGGNFSQTDKNELFNAIRVLADGLGLVPRNLITSLRIENLAKMINDPPNNEGIDADKAAAMATAGDADMHERTLTAFYSALHNLNETVFAKESFQMAEIANQNRMLNISRVDANFATYIYSSHDSTAVTQSINTCITTINNVGVSNVPLGYKRYGKSTVYYAVRLKAKAKLLFIPKEIEMEAVSAARPFGSRIGPSDLSESEFVTLKEPGMHYVINPQTNSTNYIKIECPDSAKSGTSCKLPNLPVDSASNIDWYSNKLLKTLKDGTPAAFTTQFAYDALNIALLPNPAEVGRYNILPPPSASSCEFIDTDSKGHLIYRFYAPVASKADQSKLKEVLHKYIEENFGGLTLVSTGLFGMPPQALRQMLKDGVESYVAQIDSKGEDGESITTAAIQLPTQNRPYEAGKAGYLSQEKGVTGTSKPDLFVTESDALRSSWGPQNERIPANGGCSDPKSATFKGRFGYSVKFVTLKSLMSAEPSLYDEGEEIEKVLH